MKLFLMSSDETGNMDPTVLNQILNRLPLTRDLAHCDAVVVPVSWFPGYKFNHALTALQKKIILVDFTEYGWAWEGQTENVLGRNMVHNYGHLNTPDYAMLDKWAADFPAILHFKRELLEVDKTDTLIPISFLCTIPEEPVQTKEQFDARPVEVFYSWGYSHPDRRRLHGEIFTKSDSKGIHIIDHWDQGDHFEGKHNWITIHAPHYARKPMNIIMDRQRCSKVTVSMPGAGNTCFRHSEAPVNSIMALQNDNLSWAYEWMHAVNCIRLTVGQEFEDLNTALETLPLYDIYVESQKSIDQWRPERFVPEYVIPKIRGVL